MSALPQKIKNYRISSVLAAGSSSLLALDESGNRKVVLKDIRPGLLTTTAELEAFRKIVQQLARTPSLPAARMIELLQLRSEARTTRYLVREYRDGLSIAATIEKQGKLEPEPAAQLIVRIARALGTLHEAGIVHGNLSASNVILDTNGQIQFVDCALPPAQANRAYAAPELHSGKPATAATDLYALGVLYGFLLAPGKGAEEALALAGARADVLRRMLAAEASQRPRGALIAATVIEQARVVKPPPKPAPAPPPPPAPEAENAQWNRVLQAMGDTFHPEAAAPAAAQKTSPEPSAPSSEELVPERASEMAAPRAVPAARLGMQRLVNFGQFVFMTWAVGFLLYTISRGAMTPGKPAVAPAGAAPAVFVAGTTAPVTPAPAPAEAAAQSEAVPEEMCEVPAGGALYIDPLTNKRERVEVKGFLIDRYEVTNAEFLRFTRETGTISEGNWQRYFLPGMERFPVVGVAWEDANAYAKWAGKRLPTAREWQKAAGSIDGRPFPWGQTFSGDLCAWSSSAKPVAVDSYPEGKSPFGAYNMAGNVWEWVGDSMSGRRFVMGGSYNSDEPSLGILSHLAIPAEGFRPPPDVGFRCVKDVPAGA